MSFIRSLFAKTKKWVLSLRLSILSIFIILFSLAMASMIAVFYFNFSRSMTYTARHLMDQAANFIFHDMVREIRRAQIETQMAAKIIKNKLIDVGNNEQMLTFVLSTMEREMRSSPSIQSVYWSDEKGNVILAETTESGKLLSQVVLRPKNEKDATRVITAWYADGKAIEAKTLMTDYDPRVRPWYMDAKKSGSSTITDVYHYTFFQKPFWGITVGTPVILDKDKFIGVFGANVRIDFLRKLIEKIQVSTNSIIFIVTEKGKLIAFPHYMQLTSPQLADIHAINNPAVSLSFDIYKKRQQDEFIFSVNHQDYLAAYKKIVGFGPQVWFVGILVPEQDFIGVLKKSNIITVILGFIILLIGIGLFSVLITHAVQSLKKLVHETEKIKNFQLEEDVCVESQIKEVIYLRDALNNMKIGLRAFQRYVPADLVRQLIETGINAQVGGEKKQLAVFFSDVKDFTRIAEIMDPNQLMIYTCEYFDKLSKIITQERGTIDKYIGDAIMAFWGAPLPEADPCYLAAKAALRCQKQVAELNQYWQVHAVPPFITRIGLHLGDAIVGNLGSSERINYTALGDTVNTASRLESVNEIYHTHIVVSEAFYQSIKDRFILRFLDYVTFKGKEKALRLYELIAEKNTILPFDLASYEAQFAAGFAEYQQQRWDIAIMHFLACQKIYKADHVAALFIQRCRYYKTNPPTADWAGIWRFYEK